MPGRGAIESKTGEREQTGARLGQRLAPLGGTSTVAGDPPHKAWSREIHTLDFGSDVHYAHAQERQEPMGGDHANEISGNDERRAASCKQVET